MKVLVTGADGMLGSNLVRMLIANKYDVSVLLYNLSKSNTLQGFNIKKYYGDVTIPETLDNAFKDNDIIIHSAANTSVWPARSEIVRKVNIEGTQNVIDKSLENQMKKLIFVGSASSVNTNFSITKKHLFPGAKFKLDYIDSKYHALELVLKSVNENNLPATAILPTFMIGAYDSALGSGKMVLNVANGRLKFYTGGGRNFVHVKDVANAIIKSLTPETNGKVFIIGNENLLYNDFFNLVSEVAGRKGPKTKIPNWGVKTFGLIAQFFAILTHRDPLLSYPLARISCEKQFVEYDSTEELNIIKTPIRNAIEECLDWFINNGYITNNEIRLAK